MRFTRPITTSHRVDGGAGMPITRRHVIAPADSRPSMRISGRRGGRRARMPAMIFRGTVHSLQPVLLLCAAAPIQ